MAQLGNVNIDGLSLSSAMRNDLSGGMSASAFNQKYSGSVAGFKPIALSRQVGGGSAPAAAPAPQAAPAGPSAAQQEESRWSNEGNAAYNELGAFDQAAKSPLDIYNSALDSLGIADARTRVTDLRTQLMNTENLLRSVDANVTQRTSGSLVTEAQRQKLVGSEQAPLTESLRVQGNNYEGAKEDTASILTEGKTKADLEYQGVKDKRQSIIDRLEIARDNAKNATEKVKWEKEIQLQEQKMAEEKRQFEANYALDKQSLAQAAAKSSSSSGGGGSKSSGGSTAAQKKTSVWQSIDSDITSNLSDFRSKPDFWTEKTLIPSLMRAYPELTAKEVTDRVYALRKQYE
jgi:hypothetical protein